MIEKNTIDELKKQHPKTPLFLSKFTFTDEDGQKQHVALVYRKPNVEEVARLQKEAARDPALASEGLSRSIIIKTEPENALETLRTYPLTLDKFLSESIFPLLGSGAQIHTRKL